MRRFVFLFVLLPLAIIAVVLSVANRAPVTFSLDPIRATPALSLTGPLFFFLFVALALGILIGGIATWFGQGRWRRAARAERANAARLRQEVERLRERPAALGPALPGPARDAA
jgi:type IV secretory pathway VirB2 component (pilin)